MGSDLRRGPFGPLSFLEVGLLSLAEAIKTNRLDEFIVQQETAGVGSTDEASFLRAASKVIKHEPQSDRTSRSPSGGGSTGK